MTSPLPAVATLIADRTGIEAEPSEGGRLAGALTEEARARETTVGALALRLASDDAAFQSLVDRITVQETSFFRDGAQFDALAQHVLPAIVEPLTVWSAGCSNGQEPYSIAMTLAEAGLRDWRVIATDISTLALERTRRASYRQRELRGLSRKRRDAYLVQHEDGWTVAAAIRDRVAVSRLNLVCDEPPFDAGTCSIVFCRNVLIYLGRTVVTRFLERLHDQMRAGDLLFLGYSESLWQLTDRFEPVRIGNAWVYRRRGEPATAGAALAPVLAARSPARTAGPELPLTPELLLAGGAALRSGDLVAAAAAYRQAAYLEPEDPIPHFQLGLALEALGDDRSARRAFGAALAALTAAGNRNVGGVLGGYQADELTLALRDKIGGRA
jgi:chemotaxis methyl-accepting protein methylase